MSPSLRRWLVRRSGFPFGVPGKLLTSIQALSLGDAAAHARELFPGIPITIEPAPTTPNPELERVVNRAVKAAGRRARAGAYGRQQRRAKPLGHPDGDAA